MTKSSKRRSAELAEIEELRTRLAEAEETIEALRDGAVDAVVVCNGKGPQVFSLSGADQPYRVYVERMQEGAVTVSAEGIILFCNLRFAEMTGLPLEQVMGSAITKYLSHESWQEVSSVLADAGAVAKREADLQAEGQQSLRVLLTASDLPLGELRVVCLVVTDLRAQEENTRLRLARDVAESANLAKDHFLAVLSHELRTPLTPVLMALGSLEAESGLSTVIREQIAMMKRNIGLEVRLIDDLLDINRIVTGKLRLDLETVDLEHEVRQVCRMCQGDAADKGITLETSFEGSNLCVAADSSRLHQVLWNLVNNAIKFTPAGGRVVVHAACLPGDRCAVTVRDTGIGIPAEALGRIFDAFEQGSGRITRRFGGLGLGLAICKALINLHGGLIRAESEGEGQGATFVIELPAATRPAAGAAATRASETSEGSHPRLRLLLVEDHVDTARTLTRLLERAGFTVLGADGVEKAARIAESEQFDVVVSDLGLPDGDGFDVMRRVRALRNVPGIAMSGFGMDEDMRRSREAGFAEHLVKPIDVAHLISTLRRVTGTGPNGR